MKLSHYNLAGYPSPNSARFVREDDVPSQRKDLTVTRKSSVYNSAQQVYSIPEYRVVVRKDAPADGKPTGQRLTFDLSIRNPISTTSEDFEEARQELIEFLSAGDFVDTVMRQLFPCADCDVDETP